MKKILIGLVATLSAVLCLAGGGSDTTPQLIEDCSAGVTNSVTTINRFNGDLYGVYIDVAAGATNTVTIATAKETVLTATDVASDGWYRPVTTADNAAGAEIATEYIPYLLVAEPLTITVTTSDAGTNDVAVTIRTRE